MWWRISWNASVTYKVTVNGHRSRTITPSQGLRQGDPLSPYLYILCGEALAKRLYHYSSSEPHYFPAVGPGSDRIPLLQFADETMVFIRTIKPVANTMAKLLSQYGTEVGQTTNLSKFALLFSSKTTREEIGMVRDSLGISTVTSVFTYISRGANRGVKQPIKNSHSTNYLESIIESILGEAHGYR